MQVSHCFPLNFNPNHPECAGVTGILSNYNSIIGQSRISFSGPTIFGPIIEKASEYANKISKMQENNYVILLILTDGQIDGDKNLQDIIDKIVELSFLPASIIIVGLGNDTEFESMKILDGDDKVLVHSSGLLIIN